MMQIQNSTQSTWIMIVIINKIEKMKGSLMQSKCRKFQTFDLNFIQFDNVLEIACCVNNLVFFLLRL